MALVARSRGASLAAGLLARIGVSQGSLTRMVLLSTRALLLSALSAACSVQAADTAPLGRAKGRSVLMVVVDTLRADHLGCYGYPRATSRFIDTLARRGVTFKVAITAAGRTVQSFPSILTGVCPMVHGLRRNGGGLGLAAICSGGGGGDAVLIEV